MITIVWCREIIRRITKWRTEELNKWIRYKLILYIYVNSGLDALFGQVANLSEQSRKIVK